MFDLLYDLLWLACVYIGFYRACQKLMCDHANLFKVLFDVQLRVISFTRESPAEECHANLHVLASLLTFVVMSLNPIIHSFIFVWLGFLDVVLLNRIIITISVLKVIGWAYPHLPRVVTNAMIVDLIQILFIAINYTNRASLIPVMFQLVDIAFDIGEFVHVLESAHTRLVANDNKILSKILDLQCLFVGYGKTIEKARIVTLTFITGLCFIYSGIRTWGEVLFFYYTGVRIFYLYYRKDFVDANK